MSKFAIVIPYFNPANYRSHIQKLAQCLDAFRQAGLGENVFLTGIGKHRPIGANIVFWEDDECSFMWHKERLLNLAVRRLPSHYTHVVWADSDLIVGNSWAAAVEEAFCKSQVVQCFRTAHYRTIDNHYLRSRVGALGAGCSGMIGLAWGACRSFFTEGPGLFELALVGGGDAVFALGVLYRTATPSVPWLQHQQEDFERDWSPDLFSALVGWLDQVRRWLGEVQPVATNVEVHALAHGPIHRREYAERHRMLQTLIPAKHLYIDQDRVFRWTQDGLTLIESPIRTYFYARQEDDHPTTEETDSLVQTATDLDLYSDPRD